MIRQITKLTFLHMLIFVFGETPENKTIANYDPSELLSKIFNVNESMPRAPYGSVQFFNDNNENSDYVHQGIVKFRDHINNNYYDIIPDQTNSPNNVEFQDNNKDGFKKRRRKRKQKKQHYGLLNQAITPNLGLNGVPNPAFGGQYYRPPHPRPSIASEALSAVTDALTSIALNDDYQCVARLLCEAAGGGALGSSGILQTISGLQPLLKLLSAYNGISTNPLFVFGRAVFLGMSSTGNTASCRYAYPLCPTDPEQLVHYLNNHNGGFFRFFNSPQQHQGQQNVEQFYNQLSQNYGLYNNHYQDDNHQEAQNYGFYNPNPQNYGHRLNLHSGYGQQNYGLAFPYNDNNIRYKNSEFSTEENQIQKRIQNKPIHNDSEDFHTKWTFPEAFESNRINYVNSDVFRDYNFDKDKENAVREIKTLKFPENNNDETKTDIRYERKTRGFTFPDSNRQYNDYVKSNNNVYNQYYVNKYENNNNDDDLRGFRTVYVVRGNGDPNKPEVIKLRPGETIQ